MILPNHNPLHQKNIKGFVAGTFDRFHVGHQYLLWTAASQVDFLTIVIARDKTVQSLKGRLPIYNEEERKSRVQKEGIARANVRLGENHGDFIKTLQQISPHILFLGYDQRVEEPLLQQALPELKIVRMKPYAPEFFKSSKFGT